MNTLLVEKVVRDDRKLTEFLEQALDDYSRNDKIAWIDDAWKCLLGEDEGQTFYRNNNRYFTDENLVGEIECLTERIVNKALSDHFKRIREVYLNDK